MSKQKKSDNKGNTGMWMGICITLGVAFGIMMDNIGIGIALGVAFGAALSSINRDPKEKDKEK
ncbi:hypothetical protein [Ruoffia sp. FAM 26255]|uniref:hypothetical protein n=1 Tax=Ruoffia sp. FAM 26255 TaxID=3259519 RepID=UPI003886850B